MFYLSIINYKNWHLQCFSLIQWVTHCVCYFLYLAIFLFSLSLSPLFFGYSSLIHISSSQNSSVCTHTLEPTYTHIYIILSSSFLPLFPPPSPPLLRCMPSWHTQVADGDGRWHVERKRKYFTSINDDDDD
jgi:hypothetical protein